MFNINLYTLNKRDNSTKRPTGNGASFSCVIKSESSILSPSVELDVDPINYNYAYIPAFKRYYFIVDISFNSGIWTLSLKCDVLATYKDVIGDTNLYVLRSANASDGNIIDNLYTTKTNSITNRVSITKPFNMQYPNGCFSIGVVSGGSASEVADGGQYGTLKYMTVSPVGLANLGNSLLTNEVFETIADIDIEGTTPDVIKSLIDPLSYVKSAVWLPIERYYGNVGININGWVVNDVGNGFITGNAYRTATTTVTVPKHPYTNTRGNYVNTDKYTKLWLECEPYGTVELDTSVTCNNNTISLEERLDLISGKGTLRVFSGSVLLQTLGAQIGVPIQLSQITRDYISAGQASMKGATGWLDDLMTLNWGGIVGNTYNAIGDATKSFAPKQSSTGSSGGFSAVSYGWALNSEFWLPVEDDPTHNGRPLCEMRKPSSLGGYMLIQDGDVSINGTSQEDAEIRTYLESGFYYE